MEPMKNTFRIILLAMLLVCGKLFSQSPEVALGQSYAQALEAYLNNFITTTNGESGPAFTLPGYPYWKPDNKGGINTLIKVGIGGESTSANLTVHGNIVAKEIKVVSSIVSDFVFEEDYKLMSLDELEKFLKENKHLPGIPSMYESKEKGQNLGEMDDLLLRKIEELHLYVMQLKKEIDNK